MSFRWQKGRLSASLSRRGPRANVRLGCALPVCVALAIALGACGATVSTTFETVGDAISVDCSLPWSTMDQVFDCAAADYELASMEGEQTANIIIPPKEPATIAAALAHAWREHIPASEEAVVWAWSDAAKIGLGYDRGVLSEQGQLGELLVFEICTAWEAGIVGDSCTDRMKFTIEQ